MKKFFITLAILLVVFIVLPVALAFILFFDTGKMKVTYNESFSKEEMSKALVVDSLDNAATDKVAKFTVSEADVNNIIHSAIKDNADFNKYITQLAVDITEDSYVINLSGKFAFFETRAKLTAELSKMYVSHRGSEEPAYVFTIKGMSLGRITNLKDVVMFFLKQFLTNSTLDTLTANLKLHTDLDGGRIVIYASDLREMINNAVTGENGGVSEFYFTFINDFLDHNLIEFKFYDNDAFTVNIKLDKLTGNDYGEGEYVYYGMPYENTLTKLTINGVEKKLSLDVIREAIVSLLDDELITADQMGPVSDYLFHGYNGANAPACALTSIGINNKEAYQGFNLVAASSIDERFKESVADFDGYSILQDSFDIVNLNESDINDYLKTRNIFGDKYFLHREIENGKHKVNYIALDNAYINFLEDGAIFSAGLNINGLETTITMPMLLDEDNSAGLKLVYDPEPLYFGATPEDGMQLTLEDDTQKVIFNTLKDAMNGNDDKSFTFSEDGKLTIDFGTIVDDAIDNIDNSKLAYKEFLTNNAEYELNVIAENVAANAVINIKANRI